MVIFWLRPIFSRTSLTSRQRHPPELFLAQRRVVRIGQNQGLDFGVAYLFKTVAFLFGKSE